MRNPVNRAEMPAKVQTASPHLRQLRLFQLDNPLCGRLGSAFFLGLPSSPGVYFFFGREGELLYIGQSGDLRARIGSYRHASPEKHPRRTLRLVNRVMRIEWKVCASPEEALELERRLLLEHRPPFNRAGVWQGDPWWLSVEAVEGRVCLELARETRQLGPLPSAFRYVFGSMIRCLLRTSYPSRPLAEYPHRVFDAAVPLSFALDLPSAVEVAEAVKHYAAGSCVALLSRLETMHIGTTEAEQEYWTEERERVKKYADKVIRTPHAEALHSSPVAA
ncbi:MAG: nucleotide excision repair endonuclease [Verrucomicrobiaceae bacterium]|nr:nucleotide excision repair endonuclease [Verrucomicrobiaceae bacterium]